MIRKLMKNKIKILSLIIPNKSNSKNKKIRNKHKIKTLKIQIYKVMKSMTVIKNNLQRRINKKQFKIIIWNKLNSNTPIVIHNNSKTHFMNKIIVRWKFHKICLKILINKNKIQKMIWKLKIPKIQSKIQQITIKLMNSN